MPDILATAEISGVDIEGTQFNSRIQGDILCDGIGSLISALGTGLPMVSRAGNNGVIVLTSCAVSMPHLKNRERPANISAEQKSRLVRFRLPYPDGNLWKIRCHFW